MEFRVLSATGILGSGFPEDSIRRALDWDPQVIGCDSGSTDPGPYLLGSNKLLFPRAAYARDLRLILRAARSRRIPALLGSAGGAGTDAQLAALRDILLEVARGSRLTRGRRFSLIPPAVADAPNRLLKKVHLRRWRARTSLPAASAAAGGLRRTDPVRLRPTFGGYPAHGAPPCIRAFLPASGGFEQPGQECVFQGPVRVTGRTGEARAGIR